jgi:hypothetical protein
MTRRARVRPRTAQMPAIATEAREVRLLRAAPAPVHRGMGAPNRLRQRTVVKRANHVVRGTNASVPTRSAGSWPECAPRVGSRGWIVAPTMSASRAPVAWATSVSPTVHPVAKIAEPAPAVSATAVAQRGSRVATESVRVGSSAAAEQMRGVSRAAAKGSCAVMVNAAAGSSAAPA